jgi:two-component system chemotaxis response regulator CheB
MNNPPRNLTALLIDDEAYFRKFVGQVLQKNSQIARVVEARDGREGVQQFEQIKPQLVLLDINMPHMDGLQTLAALRKLSATVPIIMLTSVAEEKVVEECVDQGATFFIRKDVPAQELAGALRDALAEFLDLKEPSA